MLFITLLIILKRIQAEPANSPAVLPSPARGFIILLANLIFFSGE